MVERANKKDFSQLKQMWKTVFCDTDLYIDLFFSELACPENTYVFREKGEICAMAYALPAPLIFSDGTEIKARYICGIATKTECRNKGMASTLLRKILGDAKAVGVDVCYLIPAEKSLFSYYERFGFTEKSFMCIRTLLPAAGAFKESEKPDISRLAAAYNALNYPFKPKRTKEDFERILKAYEVYCKGNDYAVFEQREDELYVLEQTADFSAEMQNIAHLRHLSAVFLLSYAAEEDGNKPFASLCRLNPNVKIPQNGYIQLMLN